MQPSSVFDPQSSMSGATVDLLNATLIICAVIFAIVLCLVSYCVWRFRAGPGSPEPRQVRGHTHLEILWTAGPFLILIYLFVLTVRAMDDSDPPRDTGEPDIHVIGRQFWWEVRYPKSGVVTANEMCIPAGRPMLVRLETGDVIHSFWVPQLGRKMDMLPDRANYIWIEAKQPGIYHGSCSEFCGIQHAWMRIAVTALPAEEFEAWERSQAAPAPLPTGPQIERGAQLFTQMTCVNCHSIRGFQPAQWVGPDLTHLASRRTLGAGVVENTPGNLALWIRDPQRFKPGNLMPRMQLTDDQTRDMVAYLGTLR